MYQYTCIYKYLKHNVDLDAIDKIYHMHVKLDCDIK